MSCFKWCTQTNSYKYITQDKMYKELKNFKGKKIQLILPTSPPGGKPPNVTGVVIYLDEDILKLSLKSEEDGSTKVGVYKIKYILGFVPLNHGESGGCSDGHEGGKGGEGKVTDPLVNILKPLVGKRVELFISSNSSSQNKTSVKGVLLEVSNELVTMQLDQTAPSTNPTVVTYKLSQIVGVSDSGSSKPGSSKGKITVEVSIIWPEETTFQEVDVIFIREEIQTSVKTVNGVARFICEPTGHLTIKGEDVPGFITPIKDINLSGKQKYVFESLEYISANISVTGVVLDKSQVSLITNDKVKLLAYIIPANANNQQVIWSSDNESVATVDQSGLVTALSQGIANITVTTVDGSKTTTSQIVVSSVDQIINPSPISALLGEVITLPKSLSVKLNNGSLVSLPVTWEYQGTLLDLTFTVPSQSSQETYILTGHFTQTSLTALLEIQVKTSSTSISVTGISLNTITASIFVGDSITLIPIISPSNATNKDLIWTSTNESIVSVSNGLVSAISPGFAVVTVETVDGGFKAYCQISVSPVPEIELIYATKTVYESNEEVSINVSNLVQYKNITSATNYYVKVEQTGSSRILGQGIVTIYPDTQEFNLYNITNFEATQNYNNHYFVYMSTDPTYPKSDEQTLVTNFKIGSPTPTVPKENVKVNLQIIGGPLNNKPQNILFLLAREIDKDISDITWKDYALNPDAPDSEKEFSDEVKMIGKTDSNGNVIWAEPRESLKLGGYVLLEVTPDEYVDNLNLVNPYGDDGELLKEVHLTRDGIITRNIINTYVGS